MKRPNFFVIGAAKCGTTAVYEYLKTHPSVFMSPVKEPRYFAFGFPDRLIKTEAEYLELFAAAGSRHRVVGEATPLYLFWPNAVQHIREFNKDAKLLVMLRNPVEMIVSYHQHLLPLLCEVEIDFERAWKMQDDRLVGRNLPKRCSHSALLQYRDIGKLGRQTHCVLELFPRDQVKIVLFDDFVTNTRDVYLDLLAYLEIPDDGRDQFPQVNAKAQVRSRWFQTAFDYRSVPEWLRIPGRRIGLDRVHAAMMRCNLKKVARSPKLRPKFRRKLVEAFRSEVEAISELTGRELSHWLK